MNLVKRPGTKARNQGIRKKKTNTNHFFYLHGKKMTPSKASKISGHFKNNQNNFSQVLEIHVGLGTLWNAQHYLVYKTSLLLGQNQLCLLKFLIDWKVYLPICGNHSMIYQGKPLSLPCFHGAVDKDWLPDVQMKQCSAWRSVSPLGIRSFYATP